MDYRLNRTSVGLKPVEFRGLVLLPRLPQSNQRGIETQKFHREGETPPPCLNRTSVGLKLFEHSPRGG